MHHSLKWKLLLLHCVEYLPTLRAVGPLDIAVQLKYDKINGRVAENFITGRENVIKLFFKWNLKRFLAFLALCITDFSNKIMINCLWPQMT